MARSAWSDGEVGEILRLHANRPAAGAGEAHHPALRIAQHEGFGEDRRVQGQGGAVQGTGCSSRSSRPPSPTFGAKGRSAASNSTA